jgi:3-hydroxyisobutyrate dehydrogenase-like beta-hydroxyacid dehydrogenase
MRIAFLGLGKMGSPIAKFLAGSGEDLVVWNRSAGHAEALAQAGARVASSAAEAASDADVVFSMLMDDAAVEQVILGAGPGADGRERAVIEAMRPGAIHVAMSTISVKLSQRLAERHQAREQHFVAAPVFGRPNVAEAGKLWVVIGGEEEAVATIRPLVERFSRGITVVSKEPHGAHALKIGGNYLITAMIESLSEAMVFAEAYGLDTEVFLKTVNSALFQSPFYEAYAKVMLHPPAEPGATISVGVKDMRLFREAAEAQGLKTPLADRFAEDLDRARETGLAQADWAAGLYKLAQGTLVER